MTSPGRDELSSTLRRLVDASGMSGAEVGRLAGVSKATMSRYLNGQVVAPPASVRKILGALGDYDQGLGQRATEQAQALKEGMASRVRLWRDGMAATGQRFVEIERGAEHVATFTTLIVPGLLQVEPYMRAVFSQDPVSPEDLDAAVQKRLQRQELLQDPAHRFALVMTEGALRWQITSPEVMTEQLRHIAAMARADTAGRIEVGFIPWTTAVDVLPLTSFDLYDGARAVSVGTLYGTSFLTKPGDIGAYVDQFARLRAFASFGEAAATEVDRLIAEYQELP